MRKTVGFIIVAMLMAFAPPAFGGDEEIKNGYYTVIWDMKVPSNGGSGADAPWPQYYVAHKGPFDKPNLNALDHKIPACGYFQIDVYKIDSERDRTKLASILKKGVLDWPEDSSIYHSSKKVEKECETTTTSSTSTTSTTQPGESTTTTLGTTTTTEQGTTTTTTIPDSTTTSVAGSSTTSTPPTTTMEPSTPATLAETDQSETGLMGVVAGVLGLVGLVTLGLTRRLYGSES